MDDFKVDASFKPFYIENGQFFMSTGNLIQVSLLVDMTVDESKHGILDATTQTFTYANGSLQILFESQNGKPVKARQIYEGPFSKHASQDVPDRMSPEYTFQLRRYENFVKEFQLFLQYREPLVKLKEIQNFRMAFAN